MSREDDIDSMVDDFLVERNRLNKEALKGTLFGFIQKDKKGEYTKKESSEENKDADEKKLIKKMRSISISESYSEPFKVCATLEIETLNELFRDPEKKSQLPLKIGDYATSMIEQMMVHFNQSLSTLNVILAVLGPNYIPSVDNHPLKEFIKNSFDQGVINGKKQVEVFINIEVTHERILILYGDNAGGFGDDFSKKSKSSEAKDLLSSGKFVSYAEFISGSRYLSSKKSGPLVLTGGQGRGLMEIYRSVQGRGGDLNVTNEADGARIQLSIPSDSSFRRQRKDPEDVSKKPTPIILIDGSESDKDSDTEDDLDHSGQTKNSLDSSDQNKKTSTPDREFGSQNHLFPTSALNVSLLSPVKIGIGFALP